jgi:predicted kinase
MRLIATKGFAGSGKSTLSRALSRQLGWPLIDKDDAKDLLGGHVEAAGALAYGIMFNIARRQLLQGLNVICDSPLTGKISYERAQGVARETHATLAIIECICSDEADWKQRIESRKAFHLSAHHQTDWDAYQVLIRQSQQEEQSYTISHPHLTVDTVQPLHECLTKVIGWLEQLPERDPERTTLA